MSGAKSTRRELQRPSDMSVALVMSFDTYTHPRHTIRVCPSTCGFLSQTHLSAQFTRSIDIKEDNQDISSPEKIRGETASPKPCQDS